MPPDRGQQLDRVDLEVQIRPQSPNGMILYAATTAPSPKEPPPLVHSLELENGRPKYSFRVGGGGETYEVLLADVKLPLDQWSTLRVMNDGQGRASLRVNSGPPSELFYHPPRTPPAPSPSPVRIFLGGIDPRAQQPSDSVNFIGTIGRVRLNQKNLELDKGTEGGAERMRGRGDGEEEESHLAQAENQCSREPCRNGGQCRLDRFGSFQCQCRPGFGGRLCEFPSADGVCPEDGRRWCHRGICSWQRGSDRQQQRKLLCLCPPGWRGERCGEAAREEGDGGGIRFDGKHSFLAIAPLGGEGGAEEEEGEEATGRGFSMEFRLSPATRRAGVEEQLVAMLMGTERDGAEGRMAALGMEGGRLWALQREEGELPTTKRFLSKRIKAKKTHRIRLEQVGPGEVRLLVGGRPKGVLRVPTDSSAILLLGGMPPRGIAVGPSMADHLAGIGHFEGCLDGLSVNGRRVGWQELAKMHGASLGRCQPKGESTEEEEEPKKEEGGGGEFIYTTDFPATTPFTPLPVVSISEDPLLAGHEQRGQLMGPEEGEAIDWAERGGEWDMDEPIQLTGTISPDPLPSSTELGPLATAEVGEESVEEAEEKEEEAPEEPPWTTSAPSTTTATIDEEEEDEWLMTTLVPAPAKPTPTWMTGPDSAELEGPFAGLCDPKTCGAHGSCEEVNTTHVLCICRDYWVGQQCEQFRPIEYAASFDGNAFVVFSSDEFPHLVSDREEIVEFKLRTRARYGLLFWQGQQPSSSYHLLDDEEEEDMAGEDFLSIGLLDGHLAFSYELGGGAAQLISEQPVNDGRPHLVRAIRKGRNGSLEVDGGTPVRGRSSGILAMLNVEGHIFVGGVPDLHLMTAGIHTQNFVGCLAELALNGQRIDLMANAIDGQNVRPCREWRPLRQRRRRQWLKRLLRRQRMRKAAAAEGRRRKG